MRYSTIAAILGFAATAFADSVVGPVGAFNNAQTLNNLQGANAQNIGNDVGQNVGQNAAKNANAGAVANDANAGNIANKLVDRHFITTVYSTTVSSFATTYTTAFTS